MENQQDNIQVEIKKEFESLLTTRSEGVKALAIGKMVDEEIEKRIDVVYKTIKELEKLNKELKTKKPDQARVEIVDGKEQRIESWSEGKLNEKKKLEEKISNMNAALDLALNKSEYEKLMKMMSSQNNKEEKKTDE